MYVPVYTPAGGAPDQPALAVDGNPKLGKSIGPFVAVLTALWPARFTADRPPLFVMAVGSDYLYTACANTPAGAGCHTRDWAPLLHFGTDLKAGRCRLTPD